MYFHIVISLQMKNYLRVLCEKGLTRGWAAECGIMYCIFCFAHGMVSPQGLGSDLLINELCCMYCQNCTQMKSFWGLQRKEDGKYLRGSQWLLWISFKSCYFYFLMLGKLKNQQNRNPDKVRERRGKVRSEGTLGLITAPSWTWAHIWNVCNKLYKNLRFNSVLA